MDLGNKTANNLLSKDFKTAQSASRAVIDNSLVDVFLILEEKSEFIFDFIKAKILKNLIEAVNEKNYLNLFDFTSIYSYDFSDFILVPLFKFNNEEIQKKFLELLSDESDSKKTYAVEFFTKVKRDEILEIVKRFINSEFQPLKNASIKLLSAYRDKEEFNNSINILNSDSDILSKMQAFEFLSLFGDKSAFDTLYKFFIESDFNEIEGMNILLLKSFEELISENEEEKVLNIYYSILNGLLDSVSFFEFQNSLPEGFFEFLMESDKNFAILLNFYLLFKLELLLNNDAYLIDLSKNEKNEALELKNKLAVFAECFDKNSSIEDGLKSSNKAEILTALEILDDSFNSLDSILNLIKNTNDGEVAIKSLTCLKNKNAVTPDIINIAAEKHPNLKAEILNFN